jgi:nucleoside-diphosphate-sugar epimerase
MYVLNRGETTMRGPIPDGVTLLRGDIRDPESVNRALGDHRFDVVVDWIAFVPSHIEQDIETFRGRTEQFVFISSASAYQTPPADLPVRESTVLDNPFWQYSRDKIACEKLLIQAYGEAKFPITIVRPSHTYDKTLLPFDAGYTVVDRMRKGKPVIVHGDGTSLWTLTHHRDFARAFNGLLGNTNAIGEDFHITSDEWLPWNQVFRLIGEAAGVSEIRLVHIPSEVIAEYDKDWGASLLGDKSHSMVFDNTKIKQAVPGWTAEIPFADGSREIMAWFDEDPARRVVNPKVDALMDRIIEHFRHLSPA